MFTLPSHWPRLWNARQDVLFDIKVQKLSIIRYWRQTRRQIKNPWWTIKISGGKLICTDLKWGKEVVPEQLPNIMAVREGFLKEVTSALRTKWQEADWHVEVIIALQAERPIMAQDTIYKCLNGLEEEKKLKHGGWCGMNQCWTC